MFKKILLLFFILPLLFQAQNYPVKPANYITDEAGVLSADEQNALNRKLRTFEDSTSNQIFVYLAPTLDGKEMGELCQEIFHKWEIGSKGKNNGVLIGVFVNDHKFRIHTGYGLEGALPDILTKKIQDEEMRPHFKKNDYYAGIDAGIDKLIYYSAHEYKADEKKDWTMGDYVLAGLIGYFLNVVFLLIVIYHVVSREKKEQSKKKKKQSKPWPKWLLITIAVTFAAIPCAGAILLFIMMAMVGNFSMPRTKDRRESDSSSSSYTSYDSSSSWSSSDSSSDSGSGFDGGGGGDSGGGGSDSSW